MFYKDTDLVFPPRAIPALANLRGPKWQALVQEVLQKDEMDADHLAFMLMMSRLAHCDICSLDAYRATRGCPHCAALVIKRFRGTDEDLLEKYKQAQEDIQQFIRGVNHDRN